MKKIEVPLSKTKIILCSIVLLTFVIFGLLFIIEPETFTFKSPTFTIFRIFRSEAAIRIAGIVCVSFSGLLLIFYTRKLFDSKIGLIIDQSGITDNSNGTSVGLIEWQDITEIKVLRISSTKILMIMTDKPDKYIARAKNGISKRVMKANHKTFGSPLSLTSISLKIDFDNLEAMITKELKTRTKHER